MSSEDVKPDSKSNFGDLTPGERTAALRIVDANLNRAAEGLRVVEEYCRFVLDDKHLTERCKAARHSLTAALSSVSAADRAAARDTLGDVGTGIVLPAADEAIRPQVSRYSLDQIALANWERVKQALRAIEEYAKLIAPEAAGRVEQLRYESYTLAKACVTIADSQQRLAGARLYVLIDGGSSEQALIERAEALVAAGVHVLQLRDKHLDDRTLLARARLLLRVLDDAGRTADPPDPRPLFIVNDRPDIAVLARADGVHLGQKELGVREARKIIGPEMLIGVSTHNIEQARQAVLEGASYIGCGPTFPSGTKRFDDFPGLEFLRQVAADIALPAFAIGGINRENLPQVLATGFTRVAIGGAIADQEHPREAALSVLSALAGES